MATLRERMNRKNSSGTYDIIYLETDASSVLMADGTTVETTMAGKQATITGGATTITSSNLTASRALISNASGKVAVSAVTSTELGYLDGVTSAIQTQLNAKLPLAGGTVTGTLVLSKTTDLSGTADNGPALVIGGTRTTTHIEIDSNEIQAKADGTTVSTLNFNVDGGQVTVGSGGFKSSGAITASAGMISGSTVRSDTAITDDLGTTAIPWKYVYANRFYINGAASKNYGYMYPSTLGTTTAVGVGRLLLGNATASGTADNARGQILLYGTGANYHIIQGAPTANRTLTLPDATGTIALTSSSITGNAATATTATKLGTATVGSASRPIYLNAGAPTAITTLAIANGGTGKTTAPLALYALVNGSTALAATDLADTDVIPIGDVSATTGKKVTLANLKTYLKTSGALIFDDDVSAVELGSTVSLAGYNWLVVHRNTSANTITVCLLNPTLTCQNNLKLDTLKSFAETLPTSSLSKAVDKRVEYEINSDGDWTSWTSKVWLASYTELYSNSFSYFTTQANRIAYNSSGTAIAWHLASYYYSKVLVTGALNNGTASEAYIRPFMTLSLA